MTILKTIIGTLLVCLMACSSSGGSSLSFGPDANGVSFTAPSGFSDFSKHKEANDEDTLFIWAVGSFAELSKKEESGNVSDIKLITLSKTSDTPSLDSAKDVSVCGVTGKQSPINTFQIVYFTVNDQLFVLQMSNLSDEDIEALLKSCTGK